jgi:RNA polymerase sigma-70 factor (ECF subfamily)
MADSALLELLVTALPAERRSGFVDLAGAEDRLDALWREAVAANPGIVVTPAVFAAALAERLQAELAPTEALAAIRGAELYLVCAASRGDAAALAAIEGRHFGDIDAVLARLGLADAVKDEVKQVVRCRLFVGGKGRPPRIAAYGARGDLGRWLAMVALRQALELVGRHQREVSMGDAFWEELPQRAGDAELERLAGLYRAELSQTLLEAVRSLTDRDRTLLRLHFDDRLNVDAIGKVYRVHRATAARWLARAQRTLLARTRAQLLRRLRLSHAEAASILRLVGSRLEIDLAATLKAAERAR